MSDAAERLAFFRDGQCIPAIPLCLNADRTFDPEGQRRLIRYYLEAGVGGIAVAVHTTQFAIRDPEHDLLEPVLRLTAETIDDYQASAGRTVLKVAGVCGPVAQAREEARLAASLGYDLQLLSIGGLEDHDEAALLDRTRAVADILPVIGFSMQVAVGGRLFSDAYWEGMMAIPGVVGVKAAPFDRYETIKIARAAALSDREDPPVLYTGNDDHIVVDLLTPFAFKDQRGRTREIRIVGGLLGQWSVWTEEAVKLFHALKALRQAGATEIPVEWLTLAARLTEANGAVFDAAHRFAGCIPGVHQVLVNDGHMDRILTLDPEETLSPGQAEAIARVARDYPEVTDRG